MIKVIIFDYDGVIVDSFAHIHQAYARICKKLHKKCPSKLSNFRKVYGLHSRECYSNLGFSPAEIILADTLFRDEITKQTVHPFSGIEPVLQELSQQYTLVVLSSTLAKEIKSRLSQYGYLKYFKQIVGKEKTPGPLHKMDVLPELLQKWNVKTYEVILIGDRVVDYRLAQKAGIKNLILVEYGWGYDKKLTPNYKPKVIVKKPRDILKAVNGIERSGM